MVRQLAFLPDGSILISERGGQLRIVRDGKLDSRPIDGMPKVLDRSLKGLNNILLHPRFAEDLERGRPDAAVAVGERPMQEGPGRGDALGEELERRVELGRLGPRESLDRLAGYLAQAR